MVFLFSAHLLSFFLFCFFLKTLAPSVLSVLVQRFVQDSSHCIHSKMARRTTVWGTLLVRLLLLLLLATLVACGSGKTNKQPKQKILYLRCCLSARMCARKKSCRCKVRARKHHATHRTNTTQAPGAARGKPQKVF